MEQAFFTHYELYFWLLFAGLNFSFFLVQYIINFTTYPIPLSILLSKGIFLKERLRSIYARENTDFVRFNFELVAWSLLLILAGSFLPTNFWRISFVFLALFGLLHSLYITVIVHVFNRIPNIKSDWLFLKVGWTIVGRYKWLASIIVFLLFASLGIGFYELSGLAVKFLSNVPLISITSTLLILLMILGLFHLFRYAYDKYYERTVLSSVFYMSLNWKHASKHDFLNNVDASYFQKLNIYRDKKFQQKPNFIFFCVESLGSILLKDPEFKKILRPKFEEFENALKQKDWHIVSNLSKPPIFAGGSWLSYTSFLYGLLIDDNSMYNLLFQNNQSFWNYDSILHTLKHNGYENHLLCPLGGYERKIDWKIIQRVFASDKFYHFNALEYKGPTLNYMNFGFTPPDQFSINKAYEDIIEKGKKPFSLFFSTLNSHCFWNTPVAIEKDWKNCNHPEFQLEQTDNKKSNYREKYLKAIDYQIKVIEDFLIEQDPENTIVIVFGDHQPPFITEKEHGSETICQLICKDESLLNRFRSYGFEEGANIKNLNADNLKHEGFYSMFMKEFLMYQGSSNQDIPYSPDGRVFSEEI